MYKRTFSHSSFFLILAISVWAGQLPGEEPPCTPTGGANHQVCFGNTCSYVGNGATGLTSACSPGPIIGNCIMGTWNQPVRRYSCPTVAVNTPRCSIKYVNQGQQPGRHSRPGFITNCVSNSPTGFGSPWKCTACPLSR